MQHLLTWTSSMHQRIFESLCKPGHINTRTLHVDRAHDFSEISNMVNGLHKGFRGVKLIRSSKSLFYSISQPFNATKFLPTSSTWLLRIGRAMEDPAYVNISTVFSPSGFVKEPLLTEVPVPFQELFPVPLAGSLITTPDAYQELHTYAAGTV